MFIGHYSIAFALKSKERKTSLGLLFIATQFVDILFFPLALIGVEKIEFVKNFTAVNDFVFFYPFTHGLLSVIGWSILIFSVIILFYKKKEKKRVAIVLALAVLSHWFMDLIVHTPDLPLLNNNIKFGFGLWNNKLATFGVETALLILSVVYYIKRTTFINKKGKHLILLFTIFLLLINYLNIFILPKNSNITSLTFSALAAYFIFALMAHFIDKKRI